MDSNDSPVNLKEVDMRKLLSVVNTPKRGWHIRVLGIPVPFLAIPSKASRAYAKRYDGLNQEDTRAILECQYYGHFGEMPNLNAPRKLQEKFTWEKIYYRNPLMPICADKVRARDFFLQKAPPGSNNLLVRQLGVYKNGDEIDFTQLPNSFVLKSNCGSGCQLIVRDKGKINERKVRSLTNGWMKKSANHYYDFLEWGYKDIPPRIVCEVLLEFEYKIEFFCFNGTPRFFWIVINDKTPDVRANFYDMTWKRIEVENHYPNFDKDITHPTESDFSQMVSISKSIATEFPFVRCDFYKQADGFKFSEMTFYHWGATCGFVPPEYDYIFGDMLELPEPFIEDKADK